MRGNFIERTQRLSTAECSVGLRLPVMVQDELRPLGAESQFAAFRQRLLLNPLSVEESPVAASKVADEPPSARGKVSA